MHTRASACAAATPKFATVVLLPSPGLAEVMGQAIPLHTQILIFVSDFFVQFWYLVIATPFVAYFGLRFAASDANFICIEVGPGADALQERLLRRGLITRPLGGFGLRTHLRVSVGTPEENERFLSALAKERGR